MSLDLVISSKPSEDTLALMENRRLIELHKEKSNNNFSVGDIYLGRIKKVMPGLNAAFVDVGYNKDAFLHYLDLGPNFASLNKYVEGVNKGGIKGGSLKKFKFEAEINKDGKITDLLKQNQHVLVQIAKEPISTKGPRLSSELSLAGRYMVLVPFSNRISVSQKIRSYEEKDRLKRLIKSIRPEGFGVIVRTVAENKKVADLHADLQALIDKWEECFKQLKKAKPPHRVLGELSRSSAMLRDMLNKDFNNIYVDSQETKAELKEYIASIAPGKEKIVKGYRRNIPIFEHFGIEKQIKALFGKNVTMKSGAYLVIEHTEALHVIDVNSGQRSRSKDNQEQNAIDVNMESAEEIARQLRLRDMGGIIVIDFIDMKDGANREKLFEHMKNVMSDDRAKHTILPPTKFGLVQITRQRVRPEMDIKTAEKCPCCNGTGETQATILMIDEIQNKLRYLIKQMNQKKLTLICHPFVQAYLTKGFYSIQRKWYTNYNRWVTVKKSDAYAFLEYRFFDAKGEEIHLK
ncbi:MAG: ribonuclease E/G [Flavobacteriales bacterium]|nr:ribonuclease E/G [Flavobacteriales bacterium]